jgi:hypothetical protein
MADEVVESIDTSLVDFERWGRLIMTWSTGRSYLEKLDPKLTVDQLPVPRTREEFEKQCERAGTGLEVPSSMKGLTIIRHSWDQLFISLPPKERIEEFERLIDGQGQNPSPYPFFPAFYRRYVGVPLDGSEEKKKVQAMRIGDYSISFCG